MVLSQHPPCVRFSYALYDEDGVKIPQDVVERVERVFEEMLEETWQLCTDTSKDIRGACLGSGGAAGAGAETTGRGEERAGDQLTRQICKNTSEDMNMEHALALVEQRRPDLTLQGVERQVLQWYLCRMEGWFATDLKNLSAKCWEEVSRRGLCGGGHGLMVKGDLPVLDALASHLAPCACYPILLLTCVLLTPSCCMQEDLVEGGHGLMVNGYLPVLDALASHLAPCACYPILLLTCVLLTPSCCMQEDLVEGGHGLMVNGYLPVLDALASHLAPCACYPILLLTCVLLTPSCCMQEDLVEGGHGLMVNGYLPEDLVEGGHGLMVNGYLPVLDALAAGLDIRFNHRVVNIDWSSSQDLDRSVSGGIGTAGEVLAMRVEATGVVGIENKIALLFPSCFWPSVEFLGVVADTPYACSYFLNLHKASQGERAVLVFMPAGRLAEEMEGMGESEAVAFTMLQLRKILPHAPEPIQAHITTWGFRHASPRGGQIPSPSDPTPTMQWTPLLTSTIPSAPPSLPSSSPGKPPHAPTLALFTARSPPGGKLQERRRNSSGCWVSGKGRGW
ncbi:unnamed protein product [Closterium sp. NIES-65]|nr:unnamed protein product [Closterium sp. NIES-65]